MNFLDILAAIAVPVIWGVNIAIIKTSVAEFPPIFFAGLRFLIVALLLIWWVRPPWKQMRMIGLFSFFFGSLHFGGIFFGLRGVDVSLVSILNLLNVPFAVLFAKIILNDRFSWEKTCGMGIAFIGSFVLLGEPSATVSLIHLSAVLMAIVAWGLSNSIVKLIGPINNFALNAWMGLFAAIQLLAFSSIMETGQLASLQNASSVAWLALGYIVLMASVVGYGLWYYLIGKYNVTRIVPFTLLVPIAGVLAGVFIMGEVLTLKKFVGGVITLIGVGIIQLPWRRRLKPGVCPVKPNV